MNEGGQLAGFLTSKLGVALAVAVLVGSVLTAFHGWERTAERGKSREIVESVIHALREADSLPGQVRLERKLPSGDGPYELIVTGRYRGCQVVNIQVRAMGSFQRKIFLGRRVNGGDFRIMRENPRRVRIEKGTQIRLKVV